MTGQSERAADARRASYAAHVLMDKAAVAFSKAMATATALYHAANKSRIDAETAFRVAEMEDALALRGSVRIISPENTPCPACGTAAGHDHSKGCTRLQAMRAQAYPALISDNGLLGIGTGR